MKEVEELRSALADLAKKEQNELDKLQKQLGSVGSRASLLIDHPALVSQLCAHLEEFKEGSPAAPALGTLERLRVHISEPFSAYIQELEKEVEQERVQLEHVLTVELHDLNELASLAPAAREKLSSVINETKEHIRAYELESEAVKHIKESLRLFSSVEEELANLAEEELGLVGTTTYALARPPDAFIDKIILLWKTLDDELIKAVKKELLAVEHLQGLFTQKFSLLRLAERYSQRKGFLNWILGRGRITVEDIERDLKLMIRYEDFIPYQNALLMDFKDMLTKDAIDFLRTKAPSIARDITKQTIKFTSAIAMDAKMGVRSNRVISKEFGELAAKASRRNQKVGFIMVDIDNFKNFNGYYGVTVGDNVLTFVARTMKEVVRSTDEVYRWGGEEIIVLLPGASKESALARAELIRATVQERSRSYMSVINQGTFVTEEQRYHPVEEVTVSVGVGMYPDTATTEDDLTRLVWDAVRKAKGSGRNRVVAA